MKNFPTRWWEDWGGKLGKELIDEELPNWWGGLRRKPKNHDEKTFQPGLRRRKGKPRLVERGGVCSRRNLDDEGLGQNKVFCNSLRVKLQMVNYHASFLTLSMPGRQISGYPLGSSSRTAPTRISPCHLFPFASLGTFLSASCWLPLLSLCKEDCWLGHRWSGINGRRRCCWLVGILMVELAEQLSEVHDAWGKFPGAIFFQVTLPYN